MIGSNSSFFAELRKRKVLQVAAIYGAVAWGVTEVVVTVVQQLFLPQWVSTLAVIGFVVGFPVAMFLSWTFDITSEGIQRTDVSSRRGQASIVLSMVLLVAGTAGLFLLIKPSLEDAGQRTDLPDIMANSVAILPFENAGANEADAYFSEGLSDELRGQLGRVAELRIAARSSSVAALERGMDAMAAAASLGVAHLVEGSMRRQGNRMRVSVQLIEGRTGLAVWSDTYERGTNELLNVQQTIAEEIIRRVLPEAVEVLATPATRDADANELMLLAQYYERQVRSRQVVDVEKLLEAIGFYREATEADPESALAHSRVAGALLYLGDIEAAEAPIFKALSLDPTLSEVQNTLGEFYWARGMPEADSAFRRAVELNPHNADALQNYAHITWLTVAGQAPGRDDAADLFRRALELDPLSLSRHAAYGSYLGQDGQAEKVLPVIQNIQQLFDSAESYRVVGFLHELLGELDRAIAWGIRARNLEPGNSDHVEWLAELYAEIGDYGTARMLSPEPSVGLLFQMRAYDELIDAAQERMLDEPNDVDVRYLLSFAYVATGEYENAIHILSSTGLPDTILNDQARSITEIEGFVTLVNALLASDIPTANELGRSLMDQQLWEKDWWGDIGWAGLYRACSLALLGRHEIALEVLPRIKESVQIQRDAMLRDSWCFQQYKDEAVYQDVLADQDARREALRKRLPATLAEFGVSL